MPSFTLPHAVCDLPGKDAQSLNRQYSHKITALESEAVQARQELHEAQRQLQELERQEREISATDKTRAQECRRKIAAAQSKVQVCPSDSLSAAKSIYRLRLCVNMK